MRILSIDWDYFFPDLAWMDWGHNESALMLELIWVTRVASFNTKTRESALDYVVPDLKLLYEGGLEEQPFLDRVLLERCIGSFELKVAESHVELLRWLDQRRLRQCEEVWIDNYDQHHDCGYVEGSKSSYDCGAWAQGAYDVSKLHHYQLHYPAWRAQQPERSASELKRRLGSFGAWDCEIGEPQAYEVLFICRSGGWTPPWCDEDFVELVNSAKSICGSFEILGNRDPTIPRRPSMQEALALRAQTEKRMQRWQRSITRSKLPKEIGSRRK